MVLKNAVIVDETFKLKKLDIKIDGDLITDIAEDLNDSEVIDLSGKYILPGFIDTHIHGAFGVRVSDKDPDMSQITSFEATQGVTSIAITTASSEFSDLLRQLDVVKKARSNCLGAKIAGVHAEGPFISLKYKGAMNASNILTPNVDKFRELVDRGEGLIKIVTIAPENEGSDELIKFAVKKGITVSLGHTNATFDEATRAFEAGASQITHTFNAMRNFNHREPGVLGAAFVNDEVTCEMICDYVHLHPATVQTIYKIKGADKINVISDSGHAAGITVSEFMSEGEIRYVRNGVVTLADGTIAGSAMTILDGVKHLIESGIPLPEVSKMASFNPAKTLKMQNETGSISKGKKADLVVLNKEYIPEMTFVDGVCHFKRQ
ncbi:MAG: N-acetylglucosamine-6-phosphate deacetylase [Ruminococcaceae bacterium]|nr:N-acetylglucosamine-6-phosphate deacetylase [Oscillospiraceae bacterium]